jgi:rubredoxin/uncharacterized membrane protein
MKRWECSVCGYIHEGEEPPDECPVCGADKSQFVLLEEVEGPASEGPREEVETADTHRTEIKILGKILSALQRPSVEQVATFLSRYHAHPIMVHIPNGVLPLALLFTFFALIFESSAMAVAAKVNMTFVFLAMPIVIVTGLLDWIFRFKAKLTQVFKIKLICAGVVFLASGIIALWWFINPEVYLGRSGTAILFVLFNLINFSAAATAGWYGGKLVFHNSEKKAA